MKEHPMNKIKSERGQSMVEFAISLVVILWLLAGAVEFGIALFQFIQLRDAAQEGALYGSINPTDVAGIRDRVRAASSSPINLSLLPDSDIIVTYPDSGSHCVAKGIRVRVEFDHQVFMPFAELILGNSRTISAEVIDTILNSDC